MRVPVLDEATGVASALADNHAAAWAAAEPRLLELARLRIAQLLGHPDELAGRTVGAAGPVLDEDAVTALASWPSSGLFDGRDRAVLAFVEQYVLDVATVTDEQVASLVEHLGAPGVSDFVHGVLVVEQRMRLTLAWQRLGLEATA
ncbi:MAG: carboxymuconolactone decarboxylase family protein [Acidimicrobiales bacterium]